MSTSVTRRGIALLAAATISLFAALATASQAGAATYYACVKKNGSAHVFAKKPKCKKGESKLSWNNVGPAGKNGANGANGANGKNGANGTNGTNGAKGEDLTTQTPLASGQSESGAFAIGTSGATGGFVSTGISFAQPLAAPIANAHVIDNPPATTSTNCPGKGQAARGFVCIYEAENSGLTFFDAFGFAGAGESKAAQTYGFSLYYGVSSAGFVDGMWTVTAP
jgi:hypothetical protein